MSDAIYACRHHEKEHWYKIIKFDEDLNPIVTYTCSLRHKKCDCPQGEKGKVCKHILSTLPAFFASAHIDDGWFYEAKTKSWKPPILDVIDEIKASLRGPEAGAPPAANGGGATPSEAPREVLSVPPAERPLRIPRIFPKGGING